MHDNDVALSLFPDSHHQPGNKANYGYKDTGIVHASTSWQLHREKLESSDVS